MQEKRLPNERCAARQAHPPARRETEIKFTLSLLNGVQGAENVGAQFAQKMHLPQNGLLTV